MKFIEQPSQELHSVALLADAKTLLRGLRNLLNELVWAHTPFELPAAPHLTYHRKLLVKSVYIWPDIHLEHKHSFVFDKMMTRVVLATATLLESNCREKGAEAHYLPQIYREYGLSKYINGLQHKMGHNALQAR